MKINTKVILLLLIISLSHIQSTKSGFGASFGLMKKSGNRNMNSNSSSNSSNASKSRNRSNSRGVNTTFFAVSTAITKSKTVTTTSGNTSTQTTRGGDIPDYSVYFDGWVKYLKYTDMKVKKPKAFYKNTRFAPESRAKFSGPEKDSVNIFFYLL